MKDGTITTSMSGSSLQEQDRLALTQSSTISDTNVTFTSPDEGCVSRPPSPPESGTATPLLRIPLCPTRLISRSPPLNYGAVEEGAIFRSAFPQDRNVGFMKTLGIRHVLCLVDSVPTPGYNKWLNQSDVRHTRIKVEPNKDGKIKASWDSICHAVLTIMDPVNQPGYIHCNQGRHRTGCVVACLRKVQRWPIQNIIEEYETYAYPKARSGDIDLIRSFDPEAVYQYSKKHGVFSDRRFMRRSDSVISSIDTLVAALNQARLPDFKVAEVAVVSQTTSESGDTEDVIGFVPRDSPTWPSDTLPSELDSAFSNGDEMAIDDDFLESNQDFASSNKSSRSFQIRPAMKRAKGKGHE